MKEKYKYELSIIAPMFNEEANVTRTFDKLKNGLKDFKGDWEAIFIDDGSTDTTLQKAQALATKEQNLKVISYPVNMGRGRALKCGFENAEGKYIISVDFDLSYSVEHILKLYTTLKEDPMLDMVLASPYMPGGSVENVPPFRLFVSKAGNLILRNSFPKRFHTVTSIMRGYKSEIIKSLDLESNGKEIHLEILAKALGTGYTCKEVPAVLTGRQKGKSKFRFARTSFTHILFSLSERPVIIFMLGGIFCLFLGLIMGGYITYLRFSGILNIRPLIDLVVLLIVIGVQLFSFGILAGQNGILRKEIYKLQSKIKKLADREK